MGSAVPVKQVLHGIEEEEGDDWIALYSINLNGVYHRLSCPLRHTVTADAQLLITVQALEKVQILVKELRYFFFDEDQIYHSGQ